MPTESDESCAICLQEFDNENVIHTPMPCCEVKTSTVKFCSQCIHLSCKNSQGKKNAGSCPVCRSKIQVDNNGSVIVAPPQQKGWCRSCRQTRVLVRGTTTCAPCKSRRDRMYQHRSRASQCASNSMFQSINMPFSPLFQFNR
mmetsp:Transcript_10824/g.23787  ORF Transcript_10824/g.23787 Transcript_10824/m.23787 type:complete len:143 (-) Transcript_10824:612-1040(-)